MSSVRLDQVSKSFGSTHAVRDVSFVINEGEFVTILGASGSGKTTCLRMVAGFLKPTHGKILFGPREVTNVPPYRRNTGMVFQHYALFPHLTVFKNISFGLHARRLPAQEVRARTQQALELVHLEDFADRYPKQLSGGQRQRVALARAVVIRPDVLLLDEPLAALDMKLREELQVEIRRVQQEVGITTLFVTHDQSEALSMSDRIVVMDDGRVVQADSPVNLYRRPQSRFVANFVGRTNFVRGVLMGREESNHYRFSLKQGELDSAILSFCNGLSLSPGQCCHIGFRPEDAALGERFENRVRATVSKISYFGKSVTIECLGPAQETIYVDLPNDQALPRLAEAVTVSWPASKTMMFMVEQGNEL